MALALHLGDLAHPGHGYAKSAQACIADHPGIRPSRLAGLVRLAPSATPLPLCGT